MVNKPFMLVHDFEHRPHGKSIALPRIPAYSARYHESMNTSSFGGEIRSGQIRNSSSDNPDSSHLTFRVTTYVSKFITDKKGLVQQKIKTAVVNIHYDPAVVGFSL